MAALRPLPPEIRRRYNEKKEMLASFNGVPARAYQRIQRAMMNPWNLRGHTEIWGADLARLGVADTLHPDVNSVFNTIAEETGWVISDHPELEILKFRLGIQEAALAGRLKNPKGKPALQAIINQAQKESERRARQVLQFQEADFQHD